MIIIENRVHQPPYLFYQNFFARDTNLLEYLKLLPKRAENRRSTVRIRSKGGIFHEKHRPKIVFRQQMYISVRESCR